MAKKTNPITIGTTFMKNSLLIRYRVNNKNKDTTEYTIKKEGFINILITTRMVIGNIFLSSLFSISLYCFQNNMRAKGNRKIVVELCQTFGTICPK